MKDKEILCRMVGGSIDRMIKVNKRSVMCNHCDNIEITDITTDQGGEIQQTPISLKPVKADGRLIGYVGKCTACGKIYYQ